MEEPGSALKACFDEVRPSLSVPTAVLHQQTWAMASCGCKHFLEPSAECQAGAVGSTAAWQRAWAGRRLLQFLKSALSCLAPSGAGGTRRICRPQLPEFVRNSNQCAKLWGAQPLLLTALLQLSVAMPYSTPPLAVELVNWHL